MSKSAHQRLSWLLAAVLLLGAAVPALAFHNLRAARSSFAAEARCASTS